ncbi:hypothetical protein J3Q64DRAFT_1716984 [Phycomyces blakesleeanus]|uniref:FAD/NAD(P)-binding domain-containing protein n=2 Tax=Phycomyces blakesleeanus TaxID=4837 RepID=A0A162V517_PHYB8|nr:hypothetical protein PHYBLDRAFT_185027 [Phycomyces blakesleeanus NRRL 1555(-)]OAD80013.1 hypothetical protein PHYBLDRAFT_185027 [Phycomyces blakesleeanus NRRL 1555(-)]|eukprot:XP_018298053.1 hypothetical protein PHYBLDRAFT_185027 [Phycomyces blakesleeanus NRRL 1555(-)]
MTDLKKKIIIVGGGAAGILAAMNLGCHKDKDKMEITLVDSKSFYEYTPGLCSVLYEPTEQKFLEHYGKITATYESLLKPLGITFILGRIEDIKDNKVVLHDSQEIEFDYAILCTGSSYAAPWKLSNLGGSDGDGGDAGGDDSETIELGQRIDYLTAQRKRYQEAKEIICIGGGPVGVEIATEIAHRSPTKTITLVNSQDYVLKSAPSSLGKHCQTIIENTRPIHLICGEHASPVDNNAKPDADGKYHYETDKTHTQITGDLVYNAIGIKPNTHFLAGSHSDWLNSKGYVKIDPFLHVNGTTNIYAIGDMNNHEDPKMFFTAHMQAVHCVHNLHLEINNKKPVEYKGSRVSMIVSLGPTFGIGYVSGLTLRGRPFETKKGSRIAAQMKHLIERVTMNDLRLKQPVNFALYYTHEKAQILARINSLIDIFN